LREGGSRSQAVVSGSKSSASGVQIPKAMTGFGQAKGKAAPAGVSGQRTVIRVESASIHDGWDRRFTHLGRNSRFAMCG